LAGIHPVQRLWIRWWIQWFGDEFSDSVMNSVIQWGIQWGIRRFWASSFNSTLQHLVQSALFLKFYPHGDTTGGRIGSDKPVETIPTTKPQK
jgi:hypothetical protein